MNYEVLASTIYILLPLLSKNSLIVLYNDWLVQPYEHSKRIKPFCGKCCSYLEILKLTLFFLPEGNQCPHQQEKCNTYFRLPQRLNVLHKDFFKFILNFWGGVLDILCFISTPYSFMKLYVLIHFTLSQIRLILPPYLKWPRKGIF